MSRPILRAAAVLLAAAALCAAGCSRIESAAKGVAARARGPIDKDRLEAAIDKSMGGPDTCVILADTGSGREVYRYGLAGTCMRPLPPCATFQIPMSLIALDSGGAAPTTIFKWNGQPQPTRAWEKDVDLQTGFRQQIVWVFQQLAGKVAPGVFADRLKAFDYGNHSASGPVDSFWQGPQAGGALAISTKDQVEFLRRLYGGRLPVKPESTAFVTSAMVDEIRSGSTMSGRMGTCATMADGSRQVGWWVGRLKGPKSDYVFAVSVEGEGSLPGLEVQTRFKSDLAQAGVWPAMD